MGRTFRPSGPPAADVVAIDANRTAFRPGGEELTALIDRATPSSAPRFDGRLVRQAWPNGLKAAALGCAWVGTTLVMATRRRRPLVGLQPGNLLGAPAAALPEGAV